MPKEIERIAPRIGTVFAKKYRGNIYRLTVVRSSGEIAFKVAGQTFKTPTAAAKSITKHEINGWKFWSIDALKPTSRKGRPRSVSVKIP
jgi:hypothetical protein